MIPSADQGGGFKSWFEIWISVMPSRSFAMKGKPSFLDRSYAALGCSTKALSTFRIALGLLLLSELVLRFRFLHAFYSDDGTLPLPLLMDRVDDLYKTVCLHCYFGEIWQQQVLLSIQVALALLFTIGYHARASAVLSWYMYLSLTLRNTWMNYILDRYFHYLLFLSMFLPIGEHYRLLRRSSSTGERSAPANDCLVVSPATVAVKALAVWIYLDAGMGKYRDPLGGWSYSADPLPALDTYARHTLVARFLYALLGPPGLRLLTPVVVYVELLAAPLALLGQWSGRNLITWSAIVAICGLHVGIALTLRNSTLLSLVACALWACMIPASNQANMRKTRFWESISSAFCIGALIVGCFWLETISQACDQSVKHIWSTLLHNRWNVFVGAEEYVTWEIAPGMLEDGTIVDVWGRRDEVNWNLPGGGAPCTATARPGRWRSFPYLAELEGAEGEALWSYLCKEWDRENNVDKTPGRHLLRYNFFMLQADVLPEMKFSATRKRLVQTYHCDRNETPLVEDNFEQVLNMKSEL